MNDINPLDIAVIGMACYFPEAYTLEQYWDNLSKGVCSVRTYSDEELLSRGVDRSTLNKPNYVKASPHFNRTKLFDASFFKVNPGEANIMDPQRRLFIENCWQALEDGGYVPEKYKGKIGVFGSTGINLYLPSLIQDPDIINTVGQLQLISSNEKDGLPTQTSYLLNLTGPSVNINTACSSTLVAIHLARQSLLLGDSDMVLAGGTAVILPENVGYFYERDSILSHDGYCKAFDNDSDGTLWGSGSGVVLLKRLSDAVADGDNIRAVIKGSAVNNDGANKVGYTAPSLDGQSEVIVQAYASSEISPETVTYIEAHGTGTKIGDPIEVAALTKAFKEYTQNKQFCGLGSVKTNFGHLGAAAGIASFIKAVLSLENKKLPPSLHFKEGNKSIDFKKSPFYVVTELTDVKKGPNPFRVGVSSLGVGGTNAHIILEETPEEYKQNSKESGIESAIVLSARNPRQLAFARNNLLNYLEKHPDIPLQDIAFTLQNGKRDFKHKLAFIARSAGHAIEVLKSEYSEMLINDTNYKEKIDENKNEIHKNLAKWFRNEAVDWKDLYKGNSPKRVSLPAYSFESEVYWIEPKVNFYAHHEEDALLAQKNKDMKEWFYHSSWNQTALSPAAPEKQTVPCTRLVFVDNDKLGYKVGKQLESKGDRVVFVYPGRKYQKNENGSYEISLDDSQSYQLLIKDLKENQLSPDSILHFLGLNDTPPEGYGNQIKSIYAFQKNGLFSFLKLIKAIDKNIITKEMKLISFVNNIYDITGSDAIYPAKSSILSCMKVIRQEYPNFHNRTVEFDLGFLKNKNIVSLLVNEILSDHSDIISSYRGNMRWIINYSQVKLEENTQQKGAFRKNGVYFVCGGLTGGMPALFEHIIHKYQAKLIVMDDSYLPDEKDWDDWLKQHGANEYNSLRIKTVKKLRSLGSEFIGRFDIYTDKNEVLEKIKKAEAKFGSINGVIHAAGGYAAGRIAALSEKEDDLTNLALYNLTSIGCSLVIVNELFKKRELDFRFLWVSLSNVLAGPAFFSYCAADSIAIHSALKANQSLTEPWAIFYWDSLEREWFEDLVEENMAKLYQVIKERIDEGLITTDEGNQCMELLANSRGRFNPMILSCSDLLKRYKIWVKMEGANDGPDGGNTANYKPRPNLSNPYEAPVSEVEKKIAASLEKILSVQNIGRKDNFFDLGGNSLSAIQFASKVREIAEMDFAATHIFENQTIAEISAKIASKSNQI